MLLPALSLACEAGHFTSDRADTVPAGASPALTAADIGRSWVQLAVPQPANDKPYIVRDPQGFVVLGRESTGSGKIVGPTNNYLYRSADGITWQRLPLPEKPDYFFLRDLAYGAGHYVMVGNWGNYNEIWTSTDLVTWSKLKINELEWPLFQVRRENGHFFALSVFRDFLLSDDGVSWSVIPSLTVQQEDITFGKGLFVLVGSGPIRTSRDGRVWKDHPLDCALPGACIRDPSGGINQSYHSNVVFGGGRFYVDHFVSDDGASWRLHDGPIPDDFQGGYFFRTTESKGLEAWRPGEPPTPLAVTPPLPIPPLAGGPAAPDTITAPLPTGESCLTHRCLQLGRSLYLIR